ncbi:phage tail tip lysozyme [Rhizobium leguminosarum]
MPVIISTRTLRKEPGGESTGSDAPAGAKIDILAGAEGGWVKIKVLGAPGQPEGWVSALAVDETRDTLGPIDKLVFANICAWDSLLVETSAHYMLAVAELRTDVVDGASENDGDWGPFALDDHEWATFSKKPELQIDFAPEDRKNWLAQCMVFAGMANVAQQRIAAKLSDQPTVVELYLAQIFGSSLAHAMLTQPGAQISDLAKSIPSEDMAVEGVTLGRARDEKYSEAKTGKRVVELLSADLQRALDDTRQFASQASAQILEEESTRVAPDGVPNLDINFDSSEIPASRKQIAMLIATKFGEAGYGSLQQITAIANAIAESNLNPKAVGDGGHSHGLFQLNQNGGVGEHFKDAELQDPERNISIMLDHIAKHEKSADVAFRGTTSLLAAVTIFVRNFEKPANQPAAIAKRVNIARELVI